MRCKRPHQEGGARRYDNAQHDVQREEVYRELREWIYDTVFLVRGPDGPDK